MARPWTTRTLDGVNHTRLDSLLLAGVGTLAVHEIAYLPGSIDVSVRGNGVSHSHIPLLWGLGGAVAIAALVHAVVRSLRSRTGERTIDPSWLGLTMGAFYISQEAAERAMSGSPAVSLLTEHVLWFGLLAVPIVAIVLGRLVGGIVDRLVAEVIGNRPPTARPRRLPVVSLILAPAALLRLEHALVRRGPPASTGL